MQCVAFVDAKVQSFFLRVIDVTSPPVPLKNAVLNRLDSTATRCDGVKPLLAMVNSCARSRRSNASTSSLKDNSETISSARPE